MESEPKASRWTDIFRRNFTLIRTRQSPILEPHAPSSLNDEIHGTPQDSISPYDPNSAKLNPLARILPKSIRAVKTEDTGALIIVQSALRGLQASLDALPPLKIAVGIFLECTISLHIADQARNAYQELAVDIINVINPIQKRMLESKPTQMPDSIACTARRIEEQSLYIRKQQNDSQTRELGATQGGDGGVLQCYRRVGDLFRQLQDAQIQTLYPAWEAYYDSTSGVEATERAACAPGTRIQVVTDVSAWVEGGKTKIYWVNGAAGTGKTAIAFTVCEMLKNYKQLGASFFSSPTSSDCRDIERLVPTIAHQLGRYSNPYRQALCNLLGDDPGIMTRDISAQFEYLIARPLRDMGGAMPENVVVVIDAPDVFTRGGTAHVIDTLIQQGGNLPIKFLVFSRTEPTISGRLTAHEKSLILIFSLDDVNKSVVQTDIRTYLAGALRSIQVTPSQISQLADQAGALFAFAVTAVRYILIKNGTVSHRKRMITMLQELQREDDEYYGIDRLYFIVLSDALDGRTLGDSELEARRLLLWTVVYARCLINISALIELTGIKGEKTRELALQSFRPMLHMSKHTGKVVMTHRLFSDFLLSSARARQFYCDPKHHPECFVARCFDVMVEQLRFNICDLETSRCLDKDVPRLKDRVEKAICEDSGLFYACRYWGDHLLNTKPSELLRQKLEKFFHCHLLFWMEVMNLKGAIITAEAIIKQVLDWITHEAEWTELRPLVNDARNFVSAFATSPASLSTPHIYVSMLPFTPKDSHVWTSYWPQTDGLLQLEGPMMGIRGAAPLATWNIGSSVHQAIPSADGKRIVSGLSEGAVVIWDALTGTRVIGPLKDEQGPVWTVAFSPDGTLVASGGKGRTISIWDAKKGSLLAGPCKGHLKPVFSVAFSVDGALLASGSEDHTIIMWNSRTGEPKGQPFTGHGSIVTSVAFSPNGKCLASGSYDGAIRVWDLQGTTIAGPFQGHTDYVYTVAFSPDGLRLASGSRDCTIRLWGIGQSKLPLSLLVGHSRDVSSVSFSPDGSHLVSGSWDGTIRLWDASNGNLISGPLRGHSDSVNSVSFSADGTRIISGSSDGTIRMWNSDLRASTESWALLPNIDSTRAIRSIAFSPDCRRAALGSSDGKIHIKNAYSGTLIAGPLQGHTEEVTSIAFSPDGKRLVSASNDRTIRTWDAATGASLAGQYQGHSDWVRSAVFSPNGVYIASCSDDCTVRMWYADTNKPVQSLKGHTGAVMTVAFSPDGIRIASGSADCSVKMWNVQNNAVCIWTSALHTGRVNCVRFSPEGAKVVSASNDMSILVWSSHDGNLLHGPFIGHSHWIRSAMFSPDGNSIVSSSLDLTVRVWDVQKGITTIGPFKGHTSKLNSAAFYPDGTHVISGSEDGTIRSWEITPSNDLLASALNQFVINSDGWIVDYDSQPLFWIPPDLQSCLPLPSSPVVTSSAGLIRANYTHHSLLLGRQWKACYPPTHLERTRHRKRIQLVDKARNTIAPIFPRAAEHEGVLFVIGAFIRALSQGSPELLPHRQLLQTLPGPTSQTEAEEPRDE